MASKNLIISTNKKLKKGDQMKIAKAIGIHHVSVNRFFSGAPDIVSEETATKIIDEAAKLIKGHMERAKENDRKMKEITKL